MKKTIPIVTGIVATALVAVSLMNLFAGINTRGALQVLLSALMGLSAYNHFLQTKKCDVLFWLMIIAALFGLITAFIIVLPFFQI